MRWQAFLCSANCCDARSGLDQIQRCTDKCQSQIMAAQQALYGELQAFQERMQRCLVRAPGSAIMLRGLGISLIGPIQGHGGAAGAARRAADPPGGLHVQHCLVRALVLT